MLRREAKEFKFFKKNKKKKIFKYLNLNKKKIAGDNETPDEDLYKFQV